MILQDMEKRCYTFSHFMLSPMAKGIQTLHSTVEMFNKYGLDERHSIEKKILYDWSVNHKTVISLNAGVSGDLDDILYFLQSNENVYPWAEFKEDEYSLKGVMTAISIVLTEKIYNASSYFRTKNFTFDENTGKIICLDTSKVSIEDLELLDSYGSYNTFEQVLVTMVGSFRLAN